MARLLKDLLSWLFSPVFQLAFTVLFGLATVGAAVAGQVQGGASIDTVSSWVVIGLNAVLLFTFEEPPEAPDNTLFLTARVLAVLTVATGIIEVVRRVVPELQRQSELVAFQVRGLLPWRRRHVVVCGLGSVGYALVTALRADNRDVVAIEREDRAWQIAAARARGAMVIVGDARDVDVLTRARAMRAEEVFCVSDADATNLEVASQLAGLAKGRGPKVYSSLSSAGLVDVVRQLVVRPTSSVQLLVRPTSSVQLLVRPPSSVQLLVRPPSSVQSLVRRPAEPPQLSPFDIFQSRARALVVRRLVEHAPAADQVAYYVVVGFGPLGQAIAREAAKLAHFQNFRRLRMSVVLPLSDPATLADRDQFLAEHPAFCPDPSAFDLPRLDASGADPDRWDHRTFFPRHPAWRTAGSDNDAIEYVANAEFLDWGRRAPVRDLVELLSPRLANDRVVPAVILCGPDVPQNIETGLRLAEHFLAAKRSVPVYVYLAEEDGLESVLQQVPHLHAFGPEDGGHLLDEIRSPRSQELAPRLHRAYNTLTGGTEGWEQLGYEKRVSNEEAAAHVDVKLHQLGYVARPLKGPRGEGARVERFDEHQRRLLAHLEHNRWLAERLLRGWRWGPRSDEAMTRPQMVPWSDLTWSEARKDVSQVDEASSGLQSGGYGVFPAPKTKKSDRKR